MKSLVQLNNSRTLCGLLMPLLVACFTLCPIAHAVVPAPDGGYPGYNTAEGQNALFSRTTGVYNTALGALTLFGDTTGTGNTAVGINGLRNNVTGGFNTAVGLNALFTNNADDNSAFGSYALFGNTDGIVNSAFGWAALASNTQGSGNTANGAQALLRNTTGIGNTATGRGALSFSATGDFNTAIGYSAGINVTMASNVICIGANVAGADVSDSCYVGNIFNQTSFNGMPVLINGNNKLGTTTSSKRFKREIEPMDRASEAVFSLKPVTFRYKKELDPSGVRQFGLVAEQVEKVNPDLVVRDKEGKPYSVRYDQVNAMLLNEFLKEHKAFLEEQRKVQEQRTRIENQEATVTELKSVVTQQQKSFAEQEKQIKALESGLQKVSARLEMSKPTPRIVLGNP